MKNKQISINMIIVLLSASMCTACNNKNTTNSADAGGTGTTGADGNGNVIYNITVDTQVDVEKVDEEYFITTDQIAFEFKEAEMPYYVGMQDSSFLASVEYDEVLYLGHKQYIKSLFEDAKKVAVEDTEILDVDSTTFYPRKQGITKVYITDANDKTTEYAIAVTTFNDGKNVKLAQTDWSQGCYYMNASADYDIYGYLENGEMWKDSINTIHDLFKFFEENWYHYDAAVEPILPFAYDSKSECPWGWMPSGDVLIKYRAGVCIEIAQIANYLLSEDFEDCGNILVLGLEGHIFNWFYEDGTYYLMDFTDVASGRSYGYSSTNDFLNEYCKEFKSIEEIENYIVSEKGNIEKNPLVVMYSLMGHDYMPAFVNPFMNGFTFEQTSREFLCEFEECVVEAPNFAVLYADPTLKIEVKGVKSEELPTAVKASKSASYGIELISYGNKY